MKKSLLHTAAISSKKVLGRLLRLLRVPLENYVFTQQNKPIVLMAFVFILLGSILSSSASSDIIIFSVLGLSLIIIFFYRLPSKFIFILCLVLLGIMFVEFLLSGPSSNTEKTAVWIYLFMGVGIVRQWLE